MEKLLKKMKFLKNFDLFGYPVTLTLEKDNSYRTIFGGLMALLFQMFFVSIIIVSLHDLFSYKNTTISYSQKNLGTNYGTLELNQSSLNFALKFQSSILNDWKTPYFNISLYHVTQFRNTSSVYKVKTKIPMKLCNKSDFSDLEKEFMKMELDNALCPDQNSNLSLQGNFQEDIYSYLQISLNNCEDENLCQNQTRINSIISSIGFF